MSLYDMTLGPDQPFIPSQHPLPVQMPVISTERLDIKLFGKNIASPIGVPACALTGTADRVAFLAQRGFDVITFRSRRTIYHGGNNFPHWCYVDSRGQLAESDLKNILMGSQDPFVGQEVSTANSFGVPSEEPYQWVLEYEKAKRTVLPSQMLILSVMPSIHSNITLEEDVAELASHILRTSAEVVELNLACPNSEGNLIYQDVGLSIKLIHTLFNLMSGKKRLVVKIGYYMDQGALYLLLKMTQGFLDGITTTNTFPMPIVDGQGNAYFGKRSSAGVSGATIRNLAQAQARNTVAFRDQLHLKGSLTVIAAGGVTHPDHVNQYLDMGVDVVQAAAAVKDNPMLAADWKRSVMLEK